MGGKLGSEQVYISVFGKSQERHILKIQRVPGTPANLPQALIEDDVKEQKLLCAHIIEKKYSLETISKVSIENNFIS